MIYRQQQQQTQLRIYIVIKYTQIHTNILIHIHTK